MTDHDPDDGAWRALDVFDPADVQALEQQARAAAREARAEAEDVLRVQGFDAELIASAGDQVERRVLDAHRATVAAVRRRSLM